MATLGDHVDRVATWNPARSSETEFVYVDLGSVDQSKKTITAATRTTCHDAPSRARQLLQTGDVLVSTVRPNLNAVAQVTATHNGATGSTGFTVLRPKPTLDGRYLFHWVQSPQFIADMVRKATGASYPAVSDRIVKASEIPLLPIEEQRRIAAILDQADALRAKRRQALAHLDDLTQSIFLDMFGHPVSNPKRWPTRPLSSWGEVVTGNTPSRASESNYGPGIEWIKSDNIELGGLYATKAMESLTPHGMRSARTAPAGSILIVCIAGSPSSIGRAAMLDRTVAFNQQINALIPRDDNSLFLLSQLRVSPELVRSQSTGGMKGLVSKSRLSSVQLIDPPVALQRDFRARVETTIVSRERASAAAHRCDELFEALQTRAFSGRL